MTERLIHKLVDSFVKNDLIVSEQKEVYIYSISCFVETWITIISILSLGCAFGKIIPTICFCLSFFALRNRTGGFHLATFSKCYFGSLILFGMVMWCSLVFEQQKVILWLITGIAFLFVFVVGAVNHPAMHMNDAELRGTKKMARITATIEIIFIVFMNWMKVDYGIIIYSCNGIILCALLLGIAKLTRQEVKMYGEKS